MQNHFSKNVNILFMIMAIMVLFSRAAFADTIHYDKLNRMYEILYDDGSSIRYVYDANGNITEIEKKAAPKKPGSTGEDDAKGNTGDTGKDDTGENTGDTGKDDTKEKPDDTGKDDTGENTGDTGKDDTKEKPDDTGKDDIGEKPGDTGNDDAGGKVDDSEGKQGDAVKDDSRISDGGDRPSQQDGGHQDAGNHDGAAYSLIGRQIESKNAIYQITAAGKNGTVKLIRLKKKQKVYRIPDSVTYEGSRYQVTATLVPDTNVR